jgi:hypothetical protein
MNCVECRTKTARGVMRPVIMMRISWTAAAAATLSPSVVSHDDVGDCRLKAWDKVHLVFLYWIRNASRTGK